MSAQRVVLGGSSGISQATADARYAQTLTRTAVKTAAYTAAPGDNVPADISSANVPVTLPTAPADGSRIAAKIIAVPGTPGSKSLTITCGGSDVFNKAGGSTTLTLTALFQGVVLQYDHATSIWQVQATDTPLGSGLGAAQLGSDGLLGTSGKGGSGLASSVVSALSLASLKGSAPFATGHRGGGANITPENTLEGMRRAITLGVKCINVDVWQAADNSLICVHDSTLDRTTTASGNCESATQLIAATARVDAGSWFAPGWPSVPVPTLDDVLQLARTMGVCVMIECKSNVSTRPNCMTAIVSKVIQYGMQAATILQTPNTVNFPCAAATAAGITLGYIAGGATPSLSTLQGYGVTWFTFDVTQAGYTSLYLAGLAAGGLWLDAWSTNMFSGLARQTDWAAALAVGAQSGTADEPLYALGNSPYLTSDPFASQTFGHGVIPSGANRGTFFKTSTGNWYTIIGQCGVLQGWGSRSSIQASITITQRYETITSDPTRFGYVAFGSTDDSAFSDGGGVGNGYLAILRQNGQLQLYRRTGGSSVQLATLNTTAPVAKQSVQLLVTIAGSTITLKRNDTADTVSASDTTYRGGFWHLGVNDSVPTGVQCSWSGVTLT